MPRLNHRNPLSTPEHVKEWLRLRIEARAQSRPRITFSCSDSYIGDSPLSFLGFESFGTEPGALRIVDRYVDEECMVLRLINRRIYAE